MKTPVFLGHEAILKPDVQGFINMNGHRFDLEAYLRRIDFSGPADVSPDTLGRLHYAHFHNIPFENFDILLGRGIDLAPQAIFEKLVLKKRGGYCFELNGLFLQALQALGFKARALLARVHITGTPSGRGHQLELVSIDGRDWVADVGFGGNSPRRPIPLELDNPVSMEGQTIRLADGGAFGVMLQAFKNGEWQDLYSFDLGLVVPADIAYGNHYTSTHPDTFFTSFRVAMRPIPGGEIRLLNRTLRIVANGKEDVLTLRDDPTYLNAVKTHFGIELDAEYEDLKPMPPEE
jgi:N-hydroxyarylamine O-acetyltransferase